jgi:hypothetical protein
MIIQGSEGERNNGVDQFNHQEEEEVILEWGRGKNE